ncbi:hypothetical protein BDV41DRAFT_24523 [Aspergillus transmontanensis]|uniref:Uncharacterized protein n=1 Tax=Aspergillus transmontanensis TaxID=1034304 RepID=A0A5N6VHH9_9EURO|nr:hypothetical protein BDV41DRAFT_24523 [Aspergillus transmontanensis]
MFLLYMYRDRRRILIIFILCTEFSTMLTHYPHHDEIECLRYRNEYVNLVQSVPISFRPSRDDPTEPKLYYKQRRWERWGHHCLLVRGPRGIIG